MLHEKQVEDISEERRRHIYVRLSIFFRNAYGLHMMREQARKESLIQAMQATYLDILKDDLFADRSEIIDSLSSAYRELIGEDLEPEILSHLYNFSALVDEYIGANEGV